MIEIHRAIRLLKQETKKWPVAVVGRYAETPFTILISCILSLRTQDKTTDAASARLFKLAKTPEAMWNLPLAMIRKAIYPVGFYITKAKVIKRICAILLEKNSGKVPGTDRKSVV